MLLNGNAQNAITLLCYYTQWIIQFTPRLSVMLCLNQSSHQKLVYAEIHYREPFHRKQMTPEGLEMPLLNKQGVNKSCSTAAKATTPIKTYNNLINLQYYKKIATFYSPKQFVLFVNKTLSSKSVKLLLYKLYRYKLPVHFSFIKK